MAAWSCVRSGSMTRTGWICVGGCWGVGVSGGGAFGKVSADVVDRFDCVFNGLSRGGVDQGEFFLDAESILGKAAGDVEELTGDDVSDCTDDDEGEDAGDGYGGDARETAGLKAADGGGQ